MTGIEPLIVKAGQAVVTPALRWWLGERRRHDDTRLPLSELVNRKVTDGLTRRRLAREIEAMADTVAGRLAPLGRSGALADNERQAALDAVVTAFTQVAADDEAFFAADADPDRLAALIRERAAGVPDRAGLAEPARRLYEAVLDECCVSYVQTVVHLRSFAPRADAQVLSRLSNLSDQLAMLLERLPVRSLDAPAGSDADDEFCHRYRRHVSTTLDETELFGVDVRRYRPRTTLSVAYISLAVGTSGADGDGRHGRSARSGRRAQVWRPGTLRHGRGVPGEASPERRDGPAANDAERTSRVRVEQALGGAERILLRGEAGSGKTTVLRWLAITAARGGFTAELADLNEHVPFLVRLRRYADPATPLPTPQRLPATTAETIAELAPPGWAHRRLASGRALLLVDGVDELPASRRRAVRDWLRELLAAYPGIRVVVTSRPAAATARWLEVEGFEPAMLASMTPAEVRALIAHWHLAVRDAGDLPCPPQELPRYENALVGWLEANPNLQAMATSPVLAAMLCALGLDRRGHLPPDRMSLYAAAVDLLLERRDTERDIAADRIAVTGRDKLRLLQYLAWRMSINDESETSRERAIEHLARQRAAMPQVTCEPEVIFEHLLQRSGLLREPAAGRVDFVHRTFQEYLTAREAADLADVGMLVRNAHLDSWRDVVVMAAGHANAVVRDELVGRVLDRAAAEPRNRRTLRLLAASCQQTVESLSPALLARVRDAVDALVPPRTGAEARSLAAVGEPLLRQLPSTLDGLSEPVAAATVRTAALVNGPGALDVLARYAPDPREPVQRELAKVWEFFDPHEYAERVLADAPLDDGRIEVTNPALLPALDRLRHLMATNVNVEEPLDLTRLDGVPFLWALSLSGGTPSGLTALHRHPGLEYLFLDNARYPHDPCELAGLTSLDGLFSYGHHNLRDLTFLDGLSHLVAVGLGDLTEITDFSPLRSLTGIEGLFLQKPVLRDCSWLAALPNLQEISIVSGHGPRHGLAELADAVCDVSALRLQLCDWVHDLSAVSLVPCLEQLDLTGSPVTDLTPLAELPLLSYLDIRGVPSGIDLSPLAGRRGLTIRLHRGQQVRGAEMLGPGVRLRRVSE